MQVTEFLTKNKVSFKVLAHPKTYDAQHLAQMLHVPGRVVAKTVLLRADGGDSYFVAVLPATKSIAFDRAAAALGRSKLELATEVDLAAHCPDCESGVLPPFGSQYAMQTIVDQSLVDAHEIVFEGNTHDEAIRMSFEDFRRIEQPRIVDFARPGVSEHSGKRQ